MTKLEQMKQKLDEFMRLQNELDECIELMEDGVLRQEAEEESATLFEIIDHLYSIIEKEENN